MEDLPEFDVTEYKISDNIAYMEDQMKYKKKNYQQNSDPGPGLVSDDHLDIDWNEDNRMKAIELRCKDIAFYGSRSADLFVATKVRLDDLLSELMDKWATYGSCTASPSHVRQRSQAFTCKPQRRRNLWPASPKHRSGRSGKNGSVKLGTRTSKKSVEQKGEDANKCLTPPAFKEEYILPTQTKDQKIQQANNMMFKTPPLSTDPAAPTNCTVANSDGEGATWSSWWGTPHGQSNATDGVGK